MIRLSSVLIIALTSVNASADDWFVSVQLGHASTQAPEVSFLSSTDTATVIEVTDNDTAWALNIGYELNSQWSVKAGYVDLGEGSMTVQGDTLEPNTFTQAVARAPVLGDGVTLAALYHVYQNDKLFVDVELGLLRWQADISAVGNEVNLDRDEQSTDLFFGVTRRLSLDCSVAT